MARLKGTTDEFPRRRELISLLSAALTVVLADTLLIYSLAKRDRGKPFFPSRPVRLEGSGGEKLAHYVLVAGSCKA